MISRRHRGYPGGFGIELQHRIHCTAQLESTGGLQVFMRQQNGV
jgi:hypothetical protein